MANMQSIYKRFGREICRRCINEQYGVELQPKDCRYAGPYPHVCPCCGEVRNLVGGLSLSGSVKLSLATKVPRTHGRHQIAPSA